MIKLKIGHRMTAGCSSSFIVNIYCIRLVAVNFHVFRVSLLCGMGWWFFL